MSLRVGWDSQKGIANEFKHGVSFSEAATVLADPLSIILPDPDHSMREEGLLLLCRSTSGQLLIVAPTERDDVVRLISARPMTSRERRTYERETGR